jgi:hypothetical protein
MTRADRVDHIVRKPPMHQPLDQLRASQYKSLGAAERSIG